MRASRSDRRALAVLSALALAVAATAAGSTAPGVVAAADAPAFFAVHVDDDQVFGYGFEGPISVRITDLTTFPRVVETYGWDRIQDDGAGGFHLFLDGSEQASPWDIRPGNLVEVFGATETRSLVVADLHVVSFDLDENTVWGTTDTTGTVYVKASHPGIEGFTVVPVVDGEWFADFDDAIPPYGLRVMDSAEASQPDTDGDLTITRMRAMAPPRFAFGPELQQVVGYGWPDGARITLTVDHPGTWASPDFTLVATANSGRFPGTILNTGEGNVAFALTDGRVRVKPGDVLTMSDGTTTKTQVIPDLRVSLPRYESALLSGSTTVPLPAGSFLTVGQDAAWNVGAARHEVVPAADGTWSQSFAENGGLGTVGTFWPWANQVDADGDSTGVNAPVPMVSADPVRDRVWASDVARGPVTLTVTRDGVLIDTIVVEATTVYHANCGLYDMWTRPTSSLDRPTMALFDLAGRQDLMPGDLLAVWDGVTLLEITVDILTVESANPLTELMTGTADDTVSLKLGDGCGGYLGMWAAPEDGTWSYWFDPLAFGVPPDGLSEGQVVWVIGPGGATRLRWVVGPGPVFGGFQSPVNDPPVLNTMKAGEAVEVRFSLGGDFGLDVFAQGSPSSERIPPVQSKRDAIEKTVRATTSWIRYDAVHGQYVYTWVTSRSWAGQYRQLLLTLVDGSTYVADFLLTR